ncbi:MAG: hypothetical protein IPL57_10085 [Rubrivivax sp.]|nr:hypothetical protein [Rubrivivax sp.]
METDTPLEDRVLTLRVRQHHAQWVTFSVIDHGGHRAELRPAVHAFSPPVPGMGLG